MRRQQSAKMLAQSEHQRKTIGNEKSGQNLKDVENVNAEGLSGDGEEFRFEGNCQGIVGNEASAHRVNLFEQVELVPRILGVEVLFQEVSGFGFEAEFAGACEEALDDLLHLLRRLPHFGFAFLFAWVSTSRLLDQSFDVEKTIRVLLGDYKQSRFRIKLETPTFLSQYRIRTIDFQIVVLEPAFLRLRVHIQNGLDTAQNSQIVGTVDSVSLATRVVFD